ncbi:hypothetical protein NPX13_g10114 [Xylaria arbuscula]|uniref:Uncharacterized protein n=1 Tax=Xylaria arbuscula TaxID=114810 RepID=A0A9W8THS3_9PEZI|nr:hypothetical protein NPX13_g10114 [Xylaria arbuscula]
MPTHPGLGARASSPDRGSHAHSAAFSHKPQKSRSKLRSAIRKPRYSEQHQRYLKDSWEGFVERTPREDAGADETVLKEFHWKGRDLHSQRRYLALRLRFRGEPYGYMIAHDIHDAVKLSRKRARKRRKEAKKQIRKDIKSYKKTGLRSPPTSATQESSLGPSQHHSSGKDNPKEVGSSTTKAEPKPTDVAITIQRTSPKPQQTSATPPENPFEDPPTADVKRHEHKKEKRRKKEKAKMASPEAPDASEDPFRDPEPMQVIRRR